MKLKNNLTYFNLIVEKIIYKIPKGRFELPDEIGLLLLIMASTNILFDIESEDKLNLTVDFIGYVKNKYTKNGQINLVKLKPTLGRLLATSFFDILHRKKTYLIETNN